MLGLAVVRKRALYISDQAPAAALLERLAADMYTVECLYGLDAGLRALAFGATPDRVIVGPLRDRGLAMFLQKLRALRIDVVVLADSTT
ncbi:MAG: hypothetical protein JWN04_398 [Myxococcaceae bacterium]|nr:hypothetical protein [Myxococcaceae bacterium]